MENSSDSNTVVSNPIKKRGKKLLVISMVGALLLGAGGFYATSNNLILGGTETGEILADSVEMILPVAFVPLEPLVLSLGKNANAKYLRFTAQIEVEPEFAAQVRHLKPRFMDVLNTYLRAVDESELDNPSSMTRLRAQMLRRLQVVSGNGWVKDLLITEFVLD